MDMQIYQDNSIKLDGKNTGFRVTQKQDKTVVYSVDWDGNNYKEHDMPHVRYGLNNETPLSGVPGRSVFINDLIELMNR